MSKRRKNQKSKIEKIQALKLEEFQIVVLTDVPEKGLDPITAYLNDDGWESEKNIYNTLKRNGCRVHLVGVFDHFDPLLDLLKTFSKPEKVIVFNLCESIAAQRYYESHVASLLEVLGVAYTGNDAGCLALCRNKAQTKAVVDSLKIPHILVPKFRLMQSPSQFGSSLFSDQNNQEKFIVKPLHEDGSEGISSKAIVHNDGTLKKRVDYINRIYESPALVEEFIEGREIYVSVIGNEDPIVLPPREFFFGNYAVPLASYHAKWNDDFRKKWNIHSGSAHKIESGILTKLTEGTKLIYKALGMRGYGRIDFRLDKNNQIYFLEANPNPCIESAGELARSARKAGYSYIELLKTLLNLACETSANRLSKHQHAILGSSFIGDRGNEAA